MTEQIEKKRKRVTRATQLVKDYQYVFNTDQGKRVLWHLMSSSGMLSCSVKPEEKPELVYFREGQRNLMLLILDKIGTDVEKLKKIMEDAIDERGRFNS